MHRYPTSIGEGGYVVPPQEYMQEVKKMCDSKVLHLANPLGQCSAWLACELLST